MTRTILLMGVCLLAMPAWAQDAKSPFSGAAEFMLMNDWTVSSDNGDDEKNNLAGEIDAVFDYAINDRLTLETHLMLEPMDQAQSKNPGADDDIYLESEGAYVEEIKLLYALNDQWTVFGGKYDPAYGTAFDERGLADNIFAEDYELAEKIGGGARYEADSAAIGHYGLEASAFFNDTTILSEAVITQRDRLRQSDGGAGNTNDPRSFALSADAEDFMRVKGLDVLAAYRFQHEGEADEDAGTGRDEKGVVLGAAYAWPVTTDITLDHKIEWARTFDVDGVVNDDSGEFQDRDYLYLNTVATYDAWDLSLSWTQREVDNQGVSPDNTDELAEAALGYSVTDALHVQGGVFALDEDGVDSTHAAAKLTYGVEF